MSTAPHFEETQPTHTLLFTSVLVSKRKLIKSNQDLKMIDLLVGCIVLLAALTWVK